MNTSKYDDNSWLAKFECNAYELRPLEKATIMDKIERYLNDRITDLIANDEELFIKVLNDVIEKKLVENNHDLKNSIERFIKNDEKNNEELYSTLKEDYIVVVNNDVNQINQRLIELDSRVGLLENKVDCAEKTLVEHSKAIKNVTQTLENNLQVISLY